MEVGLQGQGVTVETDTELSDLTWPELTCLLIILVTCVLITLLSWTALNLCIANGLW